MIKSLIWRLFKAAGYTILHNDQYAELEARPDYRYSATAKRAAKPGHQSIEVRDLAPISTAKPGKELAAWPSALSGNAIFQSALNYFKDYPARSLMSDDSRATIFTLVRSIKPKVVAEIGTLHAGTTEVIARALWENGDGVVHTTDPFGAERCPQIIAEWPEELQRITHYHPRTSMDFFLELERRRLGIDLALIDGNHDFEFALFDLLEAAKLIRPGGIVVMDNAEQSGPYYAARVFLLAHPEWKELGQSIASFNASTPFDVTRASVPGTSFVLLKAPDDLVVTSLPRSWGQQPILSSGVKGMSLEFGPQKTAGVLHYQTIFRAFGDANRQVVELKAVGSIPIKLDGKGAKLSHEFSAPLISDMPSRFDDVEFTIENELVWQPHSGGPSLALSVPPRFDV